MMGTVMTIITTTIIMMTCSCFYSCCGYEMACVQHTTIFCSLRMPSTLPTFKWKSANRLLREYRQFSNSHHRYILRVAITITISIFMTSFE